MNLGRFEIDKIYNEDSYKAIKDIPDNCIDLIVTDPPYKIKNTKAGGNSDLSKSIQHMNNELEEYELTESIDPIIFDEFMRVMKKPNIYIWCNHKQIPMYLDYFVTQKGCCFDIIIWHKTNAQPLFNNKYLTDKEYCLYFRKNAYCNPENYEDAKTLYDLPINIKDKKRYKHPSIKPIKIIENLIKNSSNPNDIVADFFVGSGTTPTACKNTDRHYLAFDKTKKWYDIATDRTNCIDANGQISFLLK